MKPTKIICFGDSITRAAEFSEKQRWPNLLRAGLDAWRPNQFQVYNRGVGGHTTAQGFDRLEADVIPLLPAVVLVQFGFNDANVRDWAEVARVGIGEFERNLGEFHRVIGARGGLCVFVVNHVIGPVGGRQGNGQSYEDNYRPYGAAIRAVADALAAPTVDLPRLMRSRGIGPLDLVAADGLHLTGAGNELYAAMVLEALVPVLARQWPDASQTQAQAR